MRHDAERPLVVGHPRRLGPPIVAPRPDAKNLAKVEDLEVRFADFADYARTFLNHSPITIQWYRRAYRNFREYLLEGADVDPAAFLGRLHAIDEWVRWNRRRGLSPIAVNNAWRGLRRFFRDMEDRHGVPNPFANSKPPKYQQPVPKARTGDECRRILDAAYHYPWPEPDREYKQTLAHAVIATMLLAGLRRGEVVRLQFGDLSLQEGTIRVVRGKGIAGGRDRMAYVSPQLKTILTSYLRARDRRGFTAPELFISAKTGVGLTLQGLRRIADSVRGASGIPFTPHMLRHSFITHLIRSEVPLHITRDLAGHRNIATTLGYLRVFDEDLHRNIRKMRFT